MELGLFQDQKLDLVITTELRQAIALLQYNTADLYQFIQEQATENPLIELEEPQVDYNFEAGHYRKKTSTPIDHKNYVNPVDYTAQKENHILNDLLEQVNYLHLDEEKRTILRYLVLNLDDNGYLKRSTGKLAKELNTGEAEMENCISILHKLEPIGIGSRDLKECLLLQAKHHFPDKPLIHQVIEHYLVELGDKKWQAISDKLNVTLLEIQQISDAIASLNPRPCTGLFNNEPNYLFPDISIEQENGGYKIILGDRYLPKITINQNYVNLKNSHPQVSSYIQSNYQQYNWLINSIEQRKNTMIKIANEIIKKQPSFLEHGFSHLKPMTLSNIAVAIDMHESTISRATNNKVIATPVGSFEMNKLFSAKLKKGDTGGHASSTQVKFILKQMIERENRKKPLSDQKLADKIKEKNGITISRRTVAKYRDELNILSSSKRKQLV